MKRILVVGAGLAGATVATILADKGWKIHIIDKRTHIAGNAYDYVNELGERIHKYGPHILHGSGESRSVEFLSKYTLWTPYKHHVKALLPNNSYTPLPICAKTIEDTFGIVLENEKDAKRMLEEMRVNVKIETTDDLFRATVGDKMADIFYRPYTKKMWGSYAAKIKPSVGARLPVRTNREECYFDDDFQALPTMGYSTMISNMINHENIETSLGCEYKHTMSEDYYHTFTSQPVDEFFGGVFGRLPYRSILFEERKSKVCQPSSVVNFTIQPDYTRCTQWDLFPNSPARAEDSKKKLHTKTYERPVDICDNPGEYYYPVKTEDSEDMHRRYKVISNARKDITFIGRTGLYTYFDMLPCVEKHITLANKFISLHG